MQDLPKPVIAEEELNPYAPPQTESVPDPQAVDLLESYETASKGKRFLNFLVDRAAIFGVAFAVAFILGVTEQWGLTAGLLDRMENLGPWEDLMFTNVLAIVYYWAMESIWGRTLGKLVTGTKVINDSGLPAGPWAIFGRTLARYVPFEAFSMLGSSAWHDSWSGTQVIDLRRKSNTRLSPALRKYYR